jgi:hypothetical protein
LRTGLFDLDHSSDCLVLSDMQNPCDSEFILKSSLNPKGQPARGVTRFEILRFSVSTLAEPIGSGNSHGDGYYLTGSVSWRRHALECTVIYPLMSWSLFNLSRYLLPAAIFLLFLLWQVGGPSIASAQLRVPMPEGTRSLEVLDPGTPVLMRPEAGAERRGRLAHGTRLPILERLDGPGCADGSWFRVARAGYVCGRHLQPSRLLPGGIGLPLMPPGELLPHRYAFVRHDATRTYARPDDAMVDDYVEALGEGFGLVITDSVDFQGERFLRTRRGLWVRAESMAWARGSGFQGVVFEQEPYELGWTLRAGVTVHERPGGRVIRRAGRREVLRLAPEQSGPWTRVLDSADRPGGFIRKTQLAEARFQERPEGVSDSERWLDVSVQEQVLVAYEGGRPRFATLVSTGRARRGSETPLGVHRIWVKLAFSDMSNLRYEDLSSHYAMEQVPWVQYFEGSFGLHAAFWHDDFGRRRSHGCVNLSPQDAQWIFGFTGPTLPNGWDAIFPIENEPGTAVQVRE